MKRSRTRIWSLIIGATSLVAVLLLFVYRDLNNDFGQTPSFSGPLESTVAVLETEYSQLATQAAFQRRTDSLQESALSSLATLMSTQMESITKAPTPQTPGATLTPFIVCTPPACAPDEIYHCPDNCPGGCGTICATVTPGVSSGIGQVWGKICLPGTNIPGMTIYFQEINSRQTLKYPVEENQDSYALEIPAGVYVAFAWLPEKNLGGSFSQYVRCNPRISSCTDHGLVPFVVQDGHVTTHVDICDWSGDIALFPPLPAK